MIFTKAKLLLKSKHIVFMVYLRLWSDVYSFIKNDTLKLTNHDLIKFIEKLPEKKIKINFHIKIEFEYMKLKFLFDLFLKN